MPWQAVPGKFKSGQLHSRGKSGPVVKSHKQMVAIMLSEKRKGTQDNRSTHEKASLSALKKHAR